MSAGARLARLDSVRAPGVLLVIAYHTSYRFPPASADWVGGMLRVVGWTGVDLFFALSGFLIAKILSSEQARRDFPSFVRKRAFRIVPIYVIAIAVFALADIVLDGGRQIINLWKPATFLTGYLLPFQGEAKVPFTITWSLSVELSAYLLLALLARHAWRHVPTILLIVVLAAIPLRCALALGLHWNEAAIGVFPPARLDAIAFGALGALGRFDRIIAAVRQPVWTFGALTVGTIILFRYAAWYPPLIATIGYTVLGLAGALWVVALSQSIDPPNRFTSAMAQVGLVSYFMYLFHLFFVEAVRIVSSALGIGLPFWPAFFSAAVLSFAAGKISWRWFEEPLIRYGGQRAARPVSLVP